MAELDSTDLLPGLGAQVVGFTQDQLGDPVIRAHLQELFDDRGMLVFRDLELDHASQLELAELLIQKELGPGTPREDRWYISNTREKSAAPFGRLQFHADTMWAEQPCELVSLYAVDVEQPSAPTTFVSTTDAWTRLPDPLRQRVKEARALHTAGEVRRGDMEGVILTTVVNPPTTVKPFVFRHPRTGEALIYACEQMTKHVIGLEPAESEALLDDVFAVMYDPSVQLHHHWRSGDLVAWDNLAVQHGRPNVEISGPTRTLRKVAAPMPMLTKDEIPAYSGS